MITLATKSLVAADGGFSAQMVGIGIGIAVGAVVLGRLVPLGLGPLLRRRHSPSYARVFSSLAGLLITLLGLAVAVTVIFPSVNPLAILSGLGVLSIAAGFAFQDILSNLLSGILLLLRDPFRGGDQVTVGEHTGLVKEINLRETVLRTFDGRIVYVPNAVVYTNPILVQNADDPVRTTVVLGVDYSADLDLARDLAERTIRDVPGVVGDMPVQVYAANFGTSTVDLDLRYWTGPQQAEVRRVQDLVVGQVLTAFNDAGIDMPADMTVLQGSPSLAAAIHGHGRITPGGTLLPDDD